MNGKECRRKRSWPNLRLLSRNWLEGLRKSWENLSLNNLPPSWDLNLGPSKYEKGMPPTRPRRSAGTYIENISMKIWREKTICNRPILSRRKDMNGSSKVRRRLCGFGASGLGSAPLAGPLAKHIRVSEKVGQNGLAK
jgi:hypothetical protein